MKNNIVKLVLILAVFISAISCNKQSVPLFDTPGGVHFIDTMWTYSFMANPSEQETVVKISTNLFGKTAPYDRKYVVSVITGDEERISTLPAENYELLDCIVPADSCLSEVPIKVKYMPEMDKEVFVLYLNILPNDEFPNVHFKGRKMRLEVTNKLIQPANWNGMLRYYFGMKYSDKWWRFILNSTNRTDLPYWPGADPKIWWMDDYEFQANVDLVKIEYDKYNALHPDDKLKHDDGTEVTM